MINRLDLRYFKCFETLRLPIAPLTVLSGLNASGKSSVLQALALLHQTTREHEWSDRLMLNGECVKLGRAADVIDKVNGRHTFEVGIRYNVTRYHWVFRGDRADMSMAVDRISAGNSRASKPKTLRYLLPYIDGKNSPPVAHLVRGMTYITAERIGPRDVYTLEDRQAATVVGPSGENVVSLLEWGRGERVLEGLVLRSAPNTRLRQVEERMRTFFPNCGIVLQQVPQTNAVTLGLRTSPDTDFHRPVHVGFGLTQVLPLIVAIISAKKGDLLLIENPEVHLHPAGQATMGQFLVDAAQAGLQVIIETHSDHVLNGIRRSVRTERIAPTDVAVHFFRPRSQPLPQVTSPQINKFGNIDEWPAGFFDQFDKDANYFAGWGE